MRFWSKIRKQNASYYVTIPADYARTLIREHGPIVGRDCSLDLRIEVSL